MNFKFASKQHSYSESCKQRFGSQSQAFLLLFLVFFSLTLPARADERKVQKRVAPVYPELARRMHIGGAVRVSATVAPDGNVTEAKAITGNKMLTPAAEEAVKKWKFVPGDTQSTVDIDINFEASN